MDLATQTHLTQLRDALNYRLRELRGAALCAVPGRARTCRGPLQLANCFTLIPTA